jgi:hypothetical protein
MTAYVFTGPTLSAKEAGAVWDVNCLPPAAHGDIYQAALKRPRAIGIIDGYFEGVPSVWHKEILWAMSQGIHVFGSASMGALRAAELDQFGMVGVGDIYQAYRDGLFEDDDEVAVVHGPVELGYRAVTEAMVNIRCTLAKAAATRILRSETSDALTRIAKALFYKDRDWHYDRLLQSAAEQGLPIEELDALRDWLPNERVNQKRNDAVAMLDAMKQRLAADSEPKRVDYAFEQTENWQEATRHHSTDGGPAGEHEARWRNHVLEELRLVETAYHAAVRGALLRLLAEAECDRQRIDMPDDRLKVFTKAFRWESGMHVLEDTERWLADNDLDRHAFSRLMAGEARLRVLEDMTAPQIERYLVDHLRLTGDYARLARRARDKRDTLESKGARAPNLDDFATFELEIWYFEQRLGREVPNDVEGYAVSLGFADAATFHLALWRERILLSAAQKHDESE